jgi:hypothetical protein
MALDVLPAFLSEAEEQPQYRLRPWGVCRSEPNGSDASDGVRQDAVSDGCPSAHRRDHLADVDAGKLAAQAPDVLPEDAHLACCLQPEPEAVQAPNTPDAALSAEQSTVESAVPGLVDPAAQIHPASAAVANDSQEESVPASSELPAACSQLEQPARLASPVSPLLGEPLVLRASPLAAESEPQFVAPGVAAV